MSDQETRLREFLEGMAGEVDGPPPAPRPTVRRASRGALASLVGALGTVAVVAVGAIIGLRSLGGTEQPRIPISQGPTTTAPSPGRTTTAPSPSSAGTTSKVFTAVTFVDATHGWMADSDGILATSDGGATWTRQYSGQVDITSFDFLDATHGWAVDGGGLLATSDGTTWQRLPKPTSPSFDLSSVDFVSSSVGWGVTAPTGPGAATLVRTGDGGQTWTVARAGVDSACLTDETTGYAGSQGSILKTTDGGTTWNTVFQAPGQWFSSELRCPGTDAAWVLFNGGGAAGTLDYAAFRTEDGGSTWTAELTSPLEDNNQAFNGVPAIDNYPGPFAAVSAGDAVFTGTCPACNARTTVLRTTDGTSWTRSTIDGFIPQAMSFADSTHGWLIAQAGFQGDDVLLATSDGGATWQVVFPAGSSGA